MPETENVRLTLGSDPEVFLVNQEQEIISAVGLLGGKKGDMHRVRNGGWQEDNIMAEINPDPAETVEEFTHFTTDVLGQLREHVAPLALFLRPWAVVGDNVLSMDQALQFGCSPDYDAYTNTRNPVVDSSLLANMRVAGGHLHVGFDYADDHPTFRQDVVKLLDMYVGVPSIFLEPDTRRREFYGKAGAYRPTSYGVEYRVLSNFWLNSPEYQRWIWKQVSTAVAHGSRMDIGLQHYAGTVQEAINNNHREYAQQLMDMLEIKLP